MPPPAAAVVTAEKAERVRRRLIRLWWLPNPELRRVRCLGCAAIVDSLDIVSWDPVSTLAGQLREMHVDDCPYAELDRLVATTGIPTSAEKGTA